jgi:hypothetical protein
MTTKDSYREIICRVLRSYLDITYANIDLKNRQIFDLKTDRYIILSEGWQQQHHLHSCLIHVEIINNKIWIQLDNTEDGIAEELISAGIPKSDIVLGFHELEIRQYTGFAVV